MRICLVYDCLYPVDRRRRRALVPQPRASAWPPTGHEVTYLTRRQWDAATRRDPGRRVVAVSAARGALRRRRQPRASARRCASARACSRTCCATAALRRRAHLLVPVLLAARGARRRSPARGYRLGVDWFEVWTRRLLAARTSAAPAGTIGLARAAAVRARARSARSCSRALHARAAARGGPARRARHVLGGLYAGPTRAARPPAARASRSSSSPGATSPRSACRRRAGAIARGARAASRACAARVFGDGPQRPTVLAAIAGSALEDVVEAPGFVAAEEVDDALRARALPAAALAAARATGSS